MNPNNTTFNNNPGNQGTIEATFTFPDFSNLIQKTYAEMMPQVEIDAKPLFIYKQIPQGQGDSIQVNELDFSTFADDMPEGTNAQKGKVGSGYHKQVLWFRYGSQQSITYKMRTTAQWLDVVNQTMKALTQRVPQRINLDMTHVITFGNTTSYVDMNGITRDTSTGDGLSLFNAAHLLAFSPLTYSNIVPGNPPFSKTALQASEYLTATQIMNNFGELRRMRFTHIWCAFTQSLMDNIRQYIRSVSDPAQANPGVINPKKDTYEILPLFYLATDVNGQPDFTKQNWWGIAALGGSSGDRWQAYHCEWEPPRLKPVPTGAFSTSNAEDVNNDNWVFNVRGASNYAALSGRGIIASMAPAN